MSFAHCMSKQLRTNCRDQQSRGQSGASGFSSTSAPSQALRQSSEPLSPSDSGSTKKPGLMHRLFGKAKGHKGEPHNSSSHNTQHQSDQRHSADFDKKSSQRHVQIAEESKENYPEAISAQPTADQRQERSFLSSSLPTTQAGASAIPAITRRSVVSDDHHLKAFEASRPGRIALTIAPELSEVKGQSCISHICRVNSCVCRSLLVCRLCCTCGYYAAVFFCLQ